MNYVAHSLRSADISIFSPVVTSRNTDTDRFFIIFKNISNSFNFFESLKVVLINMVEILIISAKLATLGLLKIKVFWNIDYDLIISVHDVTNKILSHDSNYNEDVVMWPKFGNSSIFMREIIIISTLKGFDQKSQFFRGALGSSSIIWDWH